MYPINQCLVESRIFFNPLVKERPFFRVSLCSLSVGSQACGRAAPVPGLPAVLVPARPAARSTQLRLRRTQHNLILTITENKDLLLEIAIGNFCKNCFLQLAKGY